MPQALVNRSFDGSPVQFRLDSCLLVCFDPLALDTLRDLLPMDTPLDIAKLLERANASFPVIGCYMVPHFRPGVFTLDPREIRKFGDEEEGFNYSEGEQAENERGDKAFPFMSVDSGTLILADVAHLPRLLTLLTWEQYNCSLRDDAVLPGITESLGGPYFAVIVSDARLGMQFDGDGTYTIPESSVKPSDG